MVTLVFTLKISLGEIMTITYELMTTSDCSAVAQLLQKSAQSKNGGLLGEFPLPKVETMFADSLSTIIARSETHIIGVVFSFNIQANSLPPIAHLIVKDYPSTMKNSWFYGPVCIDENFRGQSILEHLYNKIGTQNRGKPVAFINSDNMRSMNAHRKLGMKQVTQFIYDGTEYFLVQAE